MQLNFDSGNAAELAAVAALIGVLRGDAAPTYLRPIDGTLHTREDFDEGGSQADRLLPDAVDAAEAFDAPDPAQAFGLHTPHVAAAIAEGLNPDPAAVVIPPNPGGVDVDSTGLPWDARIHSGPADKKPKTATGTWRKKRGVDDATVAAVEASLRAAMGAAPAPVAAPEVAAVPVPPAVVPAPPVPAVAVPTAAPIAPPVTPAVAGTESGPAVVVPAASPVATDFASLMRKITGLQTSGQLTVEGTAEIAAALGITGVRDLMARPDLIPSFDALLPAVG